ncbi:hypothetical protein [Falsiroseomonas sp. E2-1-a20]|uniref:hypothetical protein n=1 Tax=Falsiroseomonas sp. E2-1-a20 TaxID=3239300 RepID=UPI003F2A30E1
MFEFGWIDRATASSASAPHCAGAGGESLTLILGSADMDVPKGYLDGANGFVALTNHLHLKDIETVMDHRPRRPPHGLRTLQAVVP